MGVINRTLDSSQQREVLESTFAALATGASALVTQVPWPCRLQASQFAAFGLSGSPTAQLVLNRFIPGTGFTAINIGSANALPAYGTSGVIPGGASLPASGSTLLNLQANDIIMVQIGGSSANVLGLSVQLVVQPIQDLKTYFNGLV